jgi:opacity protein-like surface antigen
MKILLIGLSALFVGSFAHSADQTMLGAFGGAGYSAVDVSASGEATASREPGTAFGASISTPAFSSTDVEIGIIRQQDYLQIPLLLRLGTDRLFTAAAGVFAETGATSGTDRDFVFGWNLVAGLNFDLGDRLDAFAEGRYLQDFDSVTDDGGLMALAGLRFALN